MLAILKSLIITLLASIVFLPLFTTSRSVPEVNRIATEKITHISYHAKAIKAPHLKFKVKVAVYTVSAPRVVETAPVTSTNNCVTGYSTGDYYLDKIISYESGGDSCATNPGGCFGLLQACPGAPLRETCGGNSTCQIAWFQTNKTGGRSWAEVWQHELDFGWW